MKWAQSLKPHASVDPDVALAEAERRELTTAPGQTWNLLPVYM